MIKHIRSILALPFMVLVVIPTVLLLVGGGRWLWGASSPLNIALLAAALLCAGVGLMLMVSTIRLFALQGDGTLAPWEPTQKLVVVGPYRYVRNPMISGVIFVLAGISLICGSWGVVIWAMFFACANMLYIPLSEEPGLEKRFGQSYLTYKQHVPRWVPRLRPWQPD